MEYFGQAEKARRQLEHLAQEILVGARTLSKEIYSDLIDEYEYLTSDEAIWDTLYSCDYYFTQDGKIYI